MDVKVTRDDETVRDETYIRLPRSVTLAGVDRPKYSPPFPHGGCR